MSDMSPTPHLTVVQGDEYAPSCDLVPGRIPHGPGWYLVSLANGYVDDEARGVNPQPYEAVWSARGMIVGSRRRLGRKRRSSKAS
jgi:hypothetical protein